MIQTTQSEATQASTTAFRDSLPFSATRRTSLRTVSSATGQATGDIPFAVRPERFTFCEDDLLDVDPAEISGLSDWQTQFTLRPSTSTSPAGLRHLLSRSKSSLAGLKDSSRVQNTNLRTSRPKFKLGLDKPRVKKSTRGLSGPVVLTLPQSLPSVHEVSSDEETSLHAITADDSSSHYIKSSGVSVATYTTDARPDSSSAQVHSNSELPAQFNTNSSLSPHPSIHTPTSASSIFSHSSSTLTSVRKSLKRFTSRTKGNFFSSTIPGQEVHQSFQTPSTSNEAQTSSDAPHILPELSFDTSPLSDLILEDQDIKDSPSEEQGLEVSLSTEPIQVPEPIPDIPLIRFEFVDPQELTASPAVTLGTSYSLSGASFQSPSPSWLSRNVGSFEPPTRPERPLLRIHPPSPDPLPILPRGYLEATETSRQPNNSEGLSLPGTPHSTGSSVTLYSHSQRISYLSAGSAGSRPPSINRASIVSFRQSYIDKRGSVSSFVTCASITFQRDEEDVDLVDSEKNSSTKPRFFLLLHPPSPEPTSLEVPSRVSRTSLSPLDIFGINPFNRTPNRSRISVVEPRSAPTSPTVSYERFVPPPQALYDCDRFPLPRYLAEIAKVIIASNWQEIENMDANPQAKPMETVDWGDEVDYSGYEWFKDPPPRPDPPQFVEPFVPDPAVIEKNEMFDFALKAAPNVLYGRYKQYGQLGVLAWCSEFGEMIEEIKRLGFDGSMFVSTRTQALRTCEELLKLDLQMEMQIILMYFCNQIARLRRFLDGEKEWNDYPTINFPLSPYEGES